MRLLLLAFVLALVPVSSSADPWCDTGTVRKDTLIGGDGHDRLCGRGSGDYIHGGGNADEIRGGNGPDTLVGGSGVDEVRGMMGDDFIFTVDSTKNDRIYCGGGVDRVYADRGDRVHRCEIITRR